MRLPCNLWTHETDDRRDLRRCPRSLRDMEDHENGAWGSARWPPFSDQAPGRPRALQPIAKEEPTPCVLLQMNRRLDESVAEELAGECHRRAASALEPRRPHWPRAGADFVTAFPDKAAYLA